MPNLKIDDIVQVVVSASAAETPRAAFNVGLIVGKSAHISKDTRLKLYSDLEDMEADGFLKTDPEYKAAALYFGQTPAPSKLAVGALDGEETWVQAVTACAEASSAWYGCCLASEDPIESAEHQAVAAYVEKLCAAYFYDDKSEEALTDAETDVFSVLRKLSLKRSFGLYSTTAYASAAAMGFAMGANTGEADSAYTMAYKSLGGVDPDDLSVAQIKNLQGKNANYYVRRGGTYDVLEPGVMADGDWFDNLIGIDQIANDMQRACMDVLTQTRTKVPYTDAGALRFVLACNGVCEDARNRGFIAPGVWRGSDILDLRSGDTLESGYRCQAEAVANQSAENRRKRIAPPVYIALILEGAIHFVTIQVLVEQ